MIGVAAVAIGTLISSAQSESVLSDPASEAAYLPTRQGRPVPIPFPAVARAIRKGHVVVLDTMLSDQELRAARGDVDALLHKGGGAFAANANQDASVRRDSVVWVTGQEVGVGPGLKHAVALLRGLAHEFAATPAYDESVLFVQSAAQLACYAGDSKAHYAPHLDASTDSVWTLGLSAWLRARAYRERTITAILYLNDREWDEVAVGGCLRCHVPSSDRANTSTNEKADAPMTMTQQDVAPRGGRLVLFDSAAVVHEVLPSHNKGGQRVALTVWVSDRRDR